MEPNWGIVEILLIGGLEYMSDHVSKTTTYMIYDDLNRFRFGDVYELLTYIAKKHNLENLATEEAGRLMGFLPPTSLEDATEQPAQPKRQIRFPIKAPAPLHWSKSEISQELKRIIFDSNIQEHNLWSDFIRKDSIYRGIKIRTIYTYENEKLYICEYHPMNIPFTPQRNEVGAQRANIESLIFDTLYQLKRFMPAVDYETYRDAIEYGLYKFAYAALGISSQKCDIYPESLERAGQLLGYPDDPSPVEP